MASGLAVRVAVGAGGTILGGASLTGEAGDSLWWHPDKIMAKATQYRQTRVLWIFITKCSFHYRELKIACSEKRLRSL
jgi:hypothetical protein